MLEAAISHTRMGVVVSELECPSHMSVFEHVRVLVEQVVSGALKPIDTEP